MGDVGGWYGPDYLGALLLHETVGSVYAHVVGAGHASGIAWVVGGGGVYIQRGE